MFDYLNDNKMTVQARAEGKTYSPFVLVLIYFAVMIIVNVVTNVVMTPVLTLLLTDSSNFKPFLTSLSQADYSSAMETFYKLLSELPEWINIFSLFLQIVPLAAAVIFCRFVEKRSVSSMGFRRGQIIPEYIKGLIAGAAMMAIVVMLIKLSGAAVFEGKRSFSVPTVIFYFIGYMIFGLAEEALIHGFFMTSSAKSSSLAYSLIMSSVLFSFTNSMNSGSSLLGSINVFMLGVFTGLCVMRRGNLWGMGAFHAAWNFTQNVVFGFGMSSESSRTSILKFTGLEGYNSLNGGIYGPQSSLLVTLILFLAIGAVLISKPNSREAVVYTTSESGEEKK